MISTKYFLIFSHSFYSGPSGLGSFFGKLYSLWKFFWKVVFSLVLGSRFFVNSFFIVFSYLLNSFLIVIGLTFDSIYYTAVLRAIHHPHHELFQHFWGEGFNIMKNLRLFPKQSSGEFIKINFLSNLLLRQLAQLDLITSVRSFVSASCSCLISLDRT